MMDVIALVRSPALAAALLLLGTALLCYLPGCLNGAILISHLIYRDDVRNHGSGNAGLTNTLRCFGKLPALFTLITNFDAVPGMGVMGK